MNKNNNQPNQPPQQQTQQSNVNQFQDFFPGFKLQAEQYKVKTRNGKSWPRAESPLEKSYQIFITDVVNPSNKRFYTPIDENNYPISMHDNGPSCRHVIHTIIRIKTLDGPEKLYSLGELIGYDAGSIRRSMGCDKPEVWQSISSDMRRPTIRKLEVLTYTVHGPIGNETKYLLDFNSQNFDSLYAKTWDGKNPYFKPSRKF